MPRYASIDIGTQTIRLLVADMDSSGGLNPVFRDRLIVRLGAGMSGGGRLQDDAIQRALACIKSFISLARKHKAEHIYAAATACVREAANGRAFLDHIFTETNVSVRLLTGEEEAHLSLTGVRSVFKDKQSLSLIIDIGGGSTEFILSGNQSIDCMESIPLGVVHLSEKYLLHDPPRRRRN